MTGGDTIMDFQPALDHINLRAFMKGGDVIGAGSFSAEEDQVRYVKASGLLQGDVNGDGKTDWSLVLANKVAVTDADFIF